MVITKSSVYNHKTSRELRIYVNAYHVTISDSRLNPLFVRDNGSSTNWLDSRHRAITEALEQLEKAINDAVG